MPAEPKDIARGRPPIGLTMRDIEIAMSYTKSNTAAAKYSGVSFSTFKRYARRYFDSEGRCLYDKHSNKRGLGVKRPRLSCDGKRLHDLGEILQGKHLNVHLRALKDKLVSEGLIEEKCSVCDFREGRANDSNIPLLLNFIDSNRMNFSLENLELLCLNHYFILVGNIDRRQLH
jgi:hypothetical protein